MTGVHKKDEAVLARLSRRFKAADVGTNPKGFHYVSIDATINRFNEVLGTSWSLHAGPSSLVLLDPADITYGKKQNPGYLAQAQVSIEALGSQRSGVGADFSDDADKSLKTAQAEAFKKAGHQYGVGLYLWKQAERDVVDLCRSARLPDLKMAAQLVASLSGVPAEADAIAAYFGVDVPLLQDEETLRMILTDAGLL